MPPVRQAGAIAVRLDGNTPRFLLVTARKDPSRWIFPKGHIEPGETAADTAVRELAEEAGIEGRVLGPLGVTTFELHGQDIHVQYFLIEARGSVRRRERRERKWFRHEAARKRLDFPEARRLLDKAANKLNGR
jgi:diadenosine hexaphosphate hydrolase (ATP-forming)